MLGKLLFRRILALGAALIIFVFSCAYVAFSNERIRAQANNIHQGAIVKSRHDSLPKRFLYYSRITISKRCMEVAVVYFVVLCFFIGFKNAELSSDLYLNPNKVVDNRLLWLRAWRI